VEVVWRWTKAIARQHLLLGLTGLLAVLRLGPACPVPAESGIRALYTATRIVATVGAVDPGPHRTRVVPRGFRLLHARDDRFAALFAAGIVNRLLSERRPLRNRTVDPLYHAGRHRLT